ncbi:Fc receptor-like protein 1 [Pholidichthys leucotaenia]
MEATMGLWLHLFLTSLLCCTTNQVHLIVDPNHSQFFKGDTVSLSCKHENRFVEWTLFRNTSTRQMNRCTDQWGVPGNNSCMITYVFPLDTGSYWCESTNGSIKSSSIKLNVTGGSVILRSPALPVMEGDGVTLTCRTKTATSSLTADFYKDGSFIGTDSAGHMTIKSVSKSHEGQYKCNMRGHGESPQSWISVKENPTTKAPPASAAPTIHGMPSFPSTTLQWMLWLHYLVLFCPYFISTLLVLSLFRHRASGNDTPISEDMT